MGSCFDGKIHENIVYRLPGVAPSAVRFPYIIVSERIDDAESADLITVANFRHVKEMIKKKAQQGLGLEFLISETRKMNGAAVAKWLVQIYDAYSFCERTGCQLILSSGANSTLEMISGRCFDAILNEIGIDPERHWQEMKKWLQTATSKRVMI